jgi:hypothetical protein
MEKSRCRNVYFFICLVGIIGLSSIRSQPIYGKLDFLLLDGHPWWIPWRSMIEQVIAQGEQPIISDITTSTVLRAVFAQKAIAFRFDRRYVHLDVDTLVSMNRGTKKVLPVGALFVLLGTGKNTTVGRYTLSEKANAMRDQSLVGILTDAVRKMAAMKKKYPYRCLINLHGFAPSWVPVETGHWSTQWADTSWFYEFKGKRGDDMESLLKANPPKNCTVFYKGSDDVLQ